MNTKILIIAGAIVFAVLAGFLLLSRNTGEETSVTLEPTSTPVSNPGAEMQNEEAKVTLTNAGFAPETLRVKTRTIVTWENKSQSLATVDSNVHPTHRLYPFLNLGNFDSGETISVTFQEAGTYTYHNHLNSSQTGTVIVE